MEREFFYIRKLLKELFTPEESSEISKNVFPFSSTEEIEGFMF
jgi:hypothetical protein